MASEIRVDKITSLSGVGTITPSPTGIEISGITTVATLRATTGIVTTLSVTGDVDIADTIVHTGDTNTKIRFPAADTVTVETGGNEAIRVDSSQNFGVGTNSPTARFDVRRGDTDGKIAEFHQSTGYGIDIGSSQADAYISSGYNQNFIFKTDPTSGQTERLRISSTGQLSVATTADVTGANVAIAGSMRLVNATGQSATITALPSGTYNTGVSGGSAIVFHRFSDAGGGSDEIAFETHHQGTRHGEAARFNKSGNLVFPSGQGIDFTATGDGGTVGSELLDDYEEGSFTVTLPNNGSGNQTITNNPAGRYTKIGSLVYTYIYAILSGSPQNNSDAWQLGGLPFAPSTSGFTHHGLTSIQYTAAYNYDVWRPLVASNSRIYFHRTDGSNASLKNSDVVSTGMQYWLMGAAYMV